MKQELKYWTRQLTPPLIFRLCQKLYARLSNLSGRSRHRDGHRPLKTITPGGGRPFSYRPHSVGDRGVIEQIFEERDYDFTRWPQGKVLLRRYSAAESPGSRLLIIDAGANIGASAVFFQQLVPGSVVFAIEPDPDNFELLCANTAGSDSVIAFHGAIASRDGELTLIDPGLSDWAFRTQHNAADQEDARGRVRAISPQSILADPRVSDAAPFIFKIDIEGAEAELFDGDTSWINRFPLVIIELHDWMLPFSGSSRPFLTTVAACEFDFLQHGENIFLFNRNLLAG